MTAPAWAFGVCAGVRAAGSRDVVDVPDNPLSHVLRVFEDRFRDVRLLLARREEEAFGIAAGFYLGGRQPTVMLQSSGIMGKHADGVVDRPGGSSRAAGSSGVRP